MWIRIKSRVTTPLFSFACDVVSTGRSHTEKLPISNTICYTAVSVCWLVEFTSSFYYLNSTFTKYSVDKSHCERRIRWMKIFEFFFFVASSFSGWLFWMVYFLWSDCCHFLKHTSYGQLQKKNVTKRIEYNECFETPNTKKTGWKEGKKRMPSSFNRNWKKKKKKKTAWRLIAERKEFINILFLHSFTPPMSWQRWMSWQHNDSGCALCNRVHV